MYLRSNDSNSRRSRGVLAKAGRAALTVAGGAAIFTMAACNSPEPVAHTSASVRDSLPVLRVARTGATPDQAQRLFDALRIDPKQGKLDENGLLSFLDKERFQFLPMRNLGPGEPDEDKQETTLEAFDFEAIAQIRVIDREEAMSRLIDALGEAELLPAGALRALPEGHHTTFEAVDLKGTSIVEAPIDTMVTIGTSFEDVPLHGPGAKITASFDGEGVPTQLRYAFRQIEPGDEVPIVPVDEAAARCAQAAQNGHERLEATDIQAELVYFAPALANGADVLVPYYSCTGATAETEAVLIGLLVPATDEATYVPQLRLDASSSGDQVTAAVEIEGGRAPYSISWTSSSTNLSGGDDRISYRVFGRDKFNSETITVTVTDANGVFTSASQTVPVSLKIASEGFEPKVGGVRDFGAENAVNNEFGRLDKGFVDQMKADGVTQRFVWLGTNAWEQDFKAPGDSTWIDNTDITFYVGHGSGNGFTFEDTSHDDGTLFHTDADDDWGDLDLEWLALLSCRVLSKDWGGKSHFTRWKQEFDGLHLLLGFHTLAYAWDSFSGEFASNMVDHDMTVQQAWFEAVADEQPDCVEPVVMGPFRKGDGVSNSGDHFWGKGSVGPDIRDSNIGGYWSIRVLKQNPCN
ncbi:DUF6345 domain-containing protein [Haliangium sp.]|uniref:DUF6345 domain-containing protein n=1 Tax=Haliangium sp. TaxID=2663208 RepID=UPI003D0E2C25